MRGQEVLFSSGKDDWRTPDRIIALVKEMYDDKLDLDPCAAPDPPHHFAKENWTGPYEYGKDGLVERYFGNVYVNYPYSDASYWCRKIREETERAAFTQLIALVPARTDTVAWNDLVLHAHAICLIKGRLRFVKAPLTAPFPSILVYIGPDVSKFRGVFRHIGTIWTPMKEEQK